MSIRLVQNENRTTIEIVEEYERDFDQSTYEELTNIFKSGEYNVGRIYIARIYRDVFYCCMDCVPKNVILETHLCNKNVMKSFAHLDKIIVHDAFVKEEDIEGCPENVSFHEIMVKKYSCLTKYHASIYNLSNVEIMDCCGISITEGIVRVKGLEQLEYFDEITKLACDQFVAPACELDRLNVKHLTQIANGKMDEIDLREVIKSNTVESLYVKVVKIRVRVYYRVIGDFGTNYNITKMDSNRVLQYESNYSVRTTGSDGCITIRPRIMYIVERNEKLKKGEII